MTGCRNPTDLAHRLRRLLRGGHEQRKVPGAHSLPFDANARQRHGGQPAVASLLLLLLLLLLLDCAVEFVVVAVLSLTRRDYLLDSLWSQASFQRFLELKNEASRKKMNNLRIVTLGKQNYGYIYLTCKSSGAYRIM